MSLATDRVLSQAYDYAMRRKSAVSAVDKLRTVIEFCTFLDQYEPSVRERAYRVYSDALA